VFGSCDSDSDARAGGVLVYLLAYQLAERAMQHEVLKVVIEGGEPTSEALNGAHTAYLPLGPFVELARSLQATALEAIATQPAIHNDHAFSDAKLALLSTLYSVDHKVLEETLALAREDAGVCETVRHPGPVFFSPVDAVAVGDGG
jgi:hypothetical protein